jgi:hypothetical protein
MIDRFNYFKPADGVAEWVEAKLIAEGGELSNPDHAHLVGADIAYLWASNGFTKRARTVIGQCEEVVFRCGGWQKGRQEQQMIEWFGNLPDYLITLDAEYCAKCSDVEFCALIEHELYHIGQEKDEFGAPKFTRDGLPKLQIKGHDVEEFIGVVRRYGAGHEEGQLARLIAAGNQKPEVASIDIARACGTCLLKAA